MSDERKSRRVGNVRSVWVWMMHVLRHVQLSMTSRGKIARITHLMQSKRYCARARGLQLQNLVVVTVGLDGIVELVQEVATVAGHEVHRADAALLQTLVGIERLA